MVTNPYIGSQNVNYANSADRAVADKHGNDIADTYIKRTDLLNSIYPIGAIYMSTSSANPGTLFGGTWTEWGNGRVPVGINTSDGDFNSVEKTGGEKTVNLYHSHTVNSHNHTTENHTLTVNEMPSHTHGLSVNVGMRQVYGVGSAWGYASATNELYVKSAGGGGAHNHGSTGDASPGTSSNLSTTQSIIQPYITCYMWKRTA